MSATFTKPSDLISGTTARAEDINNRIHATETGFDNVEAITTRSIKLPAGTSGDQVLAEFLPRADVQRFHKQPHYHDTLKSES